MTLERQLDKLCSEIVRRRDKGRCRICGGVGIEPHHICRKSGNVRWFLDNLIWLCRKCHNHDHEQEMNRQIIKAIGLREFEDLNIMSHQIRQWKQPALKELRSDLTEVLRYYEKEKHRI